MHNELWFPSVIWSAVINNVDNGALKKFAYDKIKEDDKISILGLTDFEPDKQFECELQHPDGNSEKIILKHSYNSSQIEWFTAGSALNVLKNKTS